MDFSGVIGGNEVGMTMLDHPQNPNSPSPWYAINDGTMCFFSPAFLANKPQSLAPAQTLSLRYRVIIHPGRWTADQVRLAAEAYAPAK
jgi:hypothetical protein